MTTCYVASSLDNYRQVQQVQQRLIAAGISIPCDWTAEYEKELADKSYKPPTRFALDMLRAANLSNVLLFLTPGRSGAHIELGAALSSNTYVVIHLAPEVRFKDFYNLADLVTPDLEEAIQAVEHKHRERCKHV